MKTKHVPTKTAAVASNDAGTRWRPERLGALVTVLILSGILVATLTPPDNMPSEVPGSDKLHHFAAFAAFVLPLAVLRPQRWVWLVPLAIALGIAIELVQPWFGRERSVGDMVANGLGAACGAVLAWLLHRPVVRLLRT